MSLTCKTILVGGVLLALLSTEALAQSDFFNPRDDQYSLLGLKRAKDAYEVAQAEYERQQELFNKQLIARTELERARKNFSDAEVNYYQSILSVLFESQYVTVTRAVKYKAGDGNRRRVSLQIANAAAGGAEFDKLVNLDDEIFRSLQPDIISDVYISLMNDENAIIGLPYEAKIEELRYGDPQTVQFTLLQDLDAVSVNIIYGNGSSRQMKVFLQKDATVNRVAIQSEQFSQEVELGGSTDFGMSLELFSGESDTYKLDVANLPSSINRYFVDQASGNRLSQFQFTEGVNTRQAALRVFLPERPTEEVQMDEAIPFYAVAIPRDRIDEIGDLRDRQLTAADIEALNIGYARLELVPRGVGEILVKAPQLFHTIKPGEEVSVRIDLVNEGTRALNNVRVDADPPLAWTDEIGPDVIQRLDINEERVVTVTLRPPADVSPGRYEVRLTTTSLSDDQPIRGEDKTINIQIEQEANVLGTLIITLLIIALVVGIVVFGIRLSRR